MDPDGDGEVTAAAQASKRGRRDVLCSEAAPVFHESSSTSREGGLFFALKPLPFLQTLPSMRQQHNHGKAGSLKPLAFHSSTSRKRRAFSHSKSSAFLAPKRQAVLALSETPCLSCSYTGYLRGVRAVVEGRRGRVAHRRHGPGAHGP